MPPPRVSVLIPARNAELFIGDAVRSILANRWPNLEIIVVDDASTDRTADVAREAGQGVVTVLANQGRGISAAHNTAMRAATGQYFMRCDADDLFACDRIARQVEWMSRHPSAAALGGLLDAMWCDGRPIDVVDGDGQVEFISERIQATGKVSVRHPTMVFRSEAIRSVGGCREFFETGEDDDLIMRLAERYPLALEHRKVYTARIHATSITRRTALGRLQWFVRKAEEFQRERLAGGLDALQRGEPPAIPGKFDGPPPRPPQVFARQLAQGSSWQLLDQGQWALGLRVALRAIRFNPGALASYLHVVRYAGVAATRAMTGRLTVSRRSPVSSPRNSSPRSTP